MPADTATVAPNGTPADAPKGASSSPDKGGGNKQLAIIIAIVSVVVAICAGIGIFMMVQNDAYEKSHRAIAVPVRFLYPDDADSIGVPVRVVGTDLDGNAVEQNLLVDPAGQDIELLRGSYQLWVSTYSISEKGLVCRLVRSDEPIDVDIDEDDPDPVVDTISIEADIIPIVDVTDDILEDIYDEYQDVGVGKDEIERLIDEAKDNRKEEKDRIAAEEERKRQEEERKRQEEERKRQEEEKAKLEAEKQSALASNPSTIPGTNTNASAPTATLTGTVRYEFSSAGPAAVNQGNVCYLELPSAVTLTGTQYGELTYAKVILPASFSQYAGQTITITSHYSARVTASIPEAPISPIYATDPTLDRVW